MNRYVWRALPSTHDFVDDYLLTPLLERGRLRPRGAPRTGNPPWLPCRWLTPIVNSYVDDYLHADRRP
jgi:hypothetical protein